MALEKSSNTISRNQIQSAARSYVKGDWDFNKTWLDQWLWRFTFEGDRTWRVVVATCSGSRVIPFLCSGSVLLSQ